MDIPTWVIPTCEEDILTCKEDILTCDILNGAWLIWVTLLRVSVNRFLSSDDFPYMISMFGHHGKRCYNQTSKYHSITTHLQNCFLHTQFAIALYINRLNITLLLLLLKSLTESNLATSIMTAWLIHLSETIVNICWSDWVADKNVLMQRMMMRRMLLPWLPGWWFDGGRWRERSGMLEERADWDRSSEGHCCVEWYGSRTGNSRSSDQRPDWCSSDHGRMASEY